VLDSAGEPSAPAAAEDPFDGLQQRHPAAEDPAGDAEQRLEHALAVAYRHLNRRERTVAEMRRHLLGRGIAVEEADRAIEVLSDQGYLDDARFAHQFAADKREFEQWGAERVRRTLLERGLDRDLVDSTLDSQPAETELDRALALLRRRFPEPIHERRERDRALGVLLRKGYDSDLALQALHAHGSA
jgi:regulatory protein